MKKDLGGIRSTYRPGGVSEMKMAPGGLEWAAEAATEG